MSAMERLAKWLEDNYARYVKYAGAMPGGGFGVELTLVGKRGVTSHAPTLDAAIHAALDLAEAQA